MEEMQLRWPFVIDHKAKEFGMALSLVADEPLDPGLLENAKKMVEINFVQWAKKTPGLHDWSFVIGETKEVWRYEDCPACDAIGVMDEITLSECDVCDGLRLIPVEIIPGKREYSFGWYSIVTTG